MKAKVSVFLLMFVAFCANVSAQGCAQCKVLAEQSAKPGELTEAAFGSNINTGIIYLMIIPYILLFFLFRKQIFDFFRKKFHKEKV